MSNNNKTPAPMAGRTKTMAVPIRNESELAADTGATRWQVRKALAELNPAEDNGRGGKYYVSWLAYPAILQVMREAEGR